MNSKPENSLDKNKLEKANESVQRETKTIKNKANKVHDSDSSDSDISLGVKKLASRPKRTAKNVTYFSNEISDDEDVIKKKKPNYNKPLEISNKDPNFPCFCDKTSHKCVKCNEKACNSCCENADDNEARYHRNFCPNGLIFEETQGDFDQKRKDNEKQRKQMLNDLGIGTAKKNLLNSIYESEENSDSNNSAEEFSFTKNGKNLEDNFQKRLLGLCSSPDKEKDESAPIQSKAPEREVGRGRGRSRGRGRGRGRGVTKPQTPSFLSGKPTGRGTRRRK